MKSLLLALMLLASPALAQTNCPGTTYLGWGQDSYLHPTNLSVTFPGTGNWATLNGPFEWDADDFYQTCNPNTWNASYNGTTAFYGTMEYNDGTISYSGACRFWLDLTYAVNTPFCVDSPVTRRYMVRRLKVQSCTPYSHVLNNHFIAVSCYGSYCEQITNDPCTTSGYISQNYLTMTISAF